MIDLHMHTFFSDGVLGVGELARRAEAASVRAMAITDHADAANLELILTRQLPAIEQLNRAMAIRILCGIELTHVPPSQIGKLTEQARKLGAQLVVVHGETIVEPVAAGTNRAAIEAGVDILAHPGLLDPSDADLAAEKGVLLEITARKGHSLTNGHVARLAKDSGAGMVINTDTHGPSDLIDKSFALKVVLGAGLAAADFDLMQQAASRLAGV